MCITEGKAWAYCPCVDKNPRPRYCNREDEVECLRQNRDKSLWIIDTTPGGCGRCRKWRVDRRCKHTRDTERVWNPDMQRYTNKYGGDWADEPHTGDEISWMRANDPDMDGIDIYGRNITPSPDKGIIHRACKNKDRDWSTRTTAREVAGRYPKFYADGVYEPTPDEPCKPLRGLGGIPAPKKPYAPWGHPSHGVRYEYPRENRSFRRDDGFIPPAGYEPRLNSSDQRDPRLQPDPDHVIDSDAIFSSREAEAKAKARAGP